MFNALSHDNNKQPKNTVTTTTKTCIVEQKPIRAKQNNQNKPKVKFTSDAEIRYTIKTAIYLSLSIRTSNQASRALLTVNIMLQI